MRRMLNHAVSAAAILGIASLAPGCIGREVSEVDPNQSVEQGKRIPVEINRDIDILFVIDNSGSMTEEQASLQQNFNRFINVLSNIEGGLPNVHIGVVSTDTGAGPFNISGCSGSGDNGILQNAPRNAGCNPPAGQFISDVANPDGTRQTNYSGDLVDTFSCIARLGIDGCGFEQPLESMRRSLDGRNAQNAGFIRESAFLAIIIISDEDDCSVNDTQMFDTSQNSIDDPLGPLSSFRCFEFGVVCNPDNARQTGAKTECVPREDSQYMFGVDEYVNFVKGLKADDQQVIVAGIIGNTDTVVVGADSNGNPELQFPGGCSSSAGDADPGIRLRAFLDAFPQRNTVTTICNEDLSDALTVIAELLRKVIGSPCLDGNLAVPLDCVVSESNSQGETRLPECNNADGAAATNHPCWIIRQDTAQCPDTPTGNIIEVFPENRSLPTGTIREVRCLAQS